MDYIDVTVTGEIAVSASSVMDFSLIAEQGFHLNDKQNDLETLRGSLAPAPPCSHAKLSIMQNEGRAFFGVP